MEINRSFFRVFVEPKSPEKSKEESSADISNTVPTETSDTKKEVKDKGIRNYSWLSQLIIKKFSPDVKVVKLEYDDGEKQDTYYFNV